jgi:hypothetical protein
MAKQEAGEVIAFRYPRIFLAKAVFAIRVVLNEDHRVFVAPVRDADPPSTARLIFVQEDQDAGFHAEKLGSNKVILREIDVRVAPCQQVITAQERRQEETKPPLRRVDLGFFTAVVRFERGNQSGNSRLVTRPECFDGGHAMLLSPCVKRAPAIPADAAFGVGPGAERAATTCTVYVAVWVAGPLFLTGARLFPLPGQFFVGRRRRRPFLGLDEVERDRQ